jgi:carbon storage regulator
MLVLSRQRDETIMIGDEVEVTVVDIRGDKVRLGISAPREVSVHRKEVYEAIKRENREAAKVRPEDATPGAAATGSRPAVRVVGLGRQGQGRSNSRRRVVPAQVDTPKAETPKVDETQST